ncbi:MAG: polysaccharide lyase 6 family protein [Bacteroidales bacterium]|jgi:poly(beta-D-mannuronate) lyase|nr:polysaccharide lyase 6 family protein [Bacteroidales bacterium]
MRSITFHTALFFITVAAGTVAAANKTLNPAQGNSAWNSTLSSGLAAGDTVFMENGTYTDFQVQFKGNGTAGSPIVLMAREAGKVKIEGQINIRMSGHYLEINGLHFRNGYAKNSDPNSTSDLLEFKTGSTVFANNSRVTNCVFDSLNNPNKSVSNENQTERWVMLFGKNNRIDHCYFGYKTVGGVMIMDDIRDTGSQNSFNILEYNFFGPRPKYTPGNGAETFRPGDSERSQLSAKCILRNNVFYRCDGEIEIVSLKSCDNIVSNNVFYECAGMVVCRHGHRNTVYGNVFIGNNKASCGGVRVINSGHKIYNNFFQGLKGTESRSALCVMTGFDDSYPLNSYYQVKDVDMSFNTFVNCTSIEIATKASYSGENAPLAPENTRFWNNLIYNTSLTKAYIDKGNTGGVDFKGNVYKISSSNSFSKDGFTEKDFDFTANGNGVMYLKGPAVGYCMPLLFAEKGIDYVTDDISGKSRNNFQEVGAVNIENVREKYNIPAVNEVGVTWYNYIKPTY